MRILIITLIMALALLPLTARATDAKAPPPACKGADKACLLKALGDVTAQIDQASWRDQTYREMAKLLTRDGQPDAAVLLIDKIQDPDTQAMTIRGIGMAAASLHLDKAAYDSLFAKLQIEADKIQHPPSHAIALTYIAMSQAFAGDNAGAMKTANAMENSALRNKAHNEAAKIQADRGEFDAALASINAIDDPAFRDKAHYTIAKIFSNNKKFDEALGSADKIINTYQHAQAILYILTKQIMPDEVVPDNDSVQ